MATVTMTLAYPGMLPSEPRFRTSSISAAPVSNKEEKRLLNGEVGQPSAPIPSAAGATGPKPSLLLFLGPLQACK